MEKYFYTIIIYHLLIIIFVSLYSSHIVVYLYHDCHIIVVLFYCYRML